MHEGSNLLDGSIVLVEAVDIEGDDRFEGVIVEPIFPELPFRRMAKRQYGKNREWMGESRE